MEVGLPEAVSCKKHFPALAVLFAAGILALVLSVRLSSHS